MENLDRSSPHPSGGAEPMVEIVRKAVREEFLQRQREWTAKQVEASQQQLDCLVACLERLFLQHSRQICFRLDMELRRLDSGSGSMLRSGSSLCEMDGASTSEISREMNSRKLQQPITMGLTRRSQSLGSMPNPSPTVVLENREEEALEEEFEGGRDDARAGGAEKKKADEGTAAAAATEAGEGSRTGVSPSAEPPSSASASILSPARTNESPRRVRAKISPDATGLRLPSAALRAPQEPNSAGRRLKVWSWQTPRGKGSSSSEGGEEDDEEQQVPAELAVARSARSRCQVLSPRLLRDSRSIFGTSPKSFRSLGIFMQTEDNGSDFRSEATQENDKERHQWKHHVRQQITRRLSDINSQSSLAQTVSGLLGIHPHLETIRRSRTEQTLNEKKDPPRSKVEELVDSHAFHLICGLFIVANGVFIGIETDVAIRSVLSDPPEATPKWMRSMNQFFIIVFLLEVALRLYAKTWRFFCSEDWKWNIFDLALTVYSVVEEWALQIDERGGFSLTYTRLIRGFRMVRVLRVIRVMRFFRELRLMVCSIMKSVVSLSWAMVLMGIIIFMFTVCFTHGATVYLEDGRHQVEAGGDKVKEQLAAFYGSLLLGMYSLLMAVSGGDDWVNFVNPLAEISPFYQVMFSFYIFFVVIGVVNVVTSAFVQRACELSKLDRDLLIQGEMVSQEAWVEEMRGIFEEVDEDGSGQITWEEFRGFMENVHVQAYFATQQLDTSDARELFTLLDADGNGYVGLEEFIMGCQKLRGQAKSSDVATLLRENKRSSRKFMRALRKMEARLGAVCNSMGLDMAESSQASFLQSPSHWISSCTPASHGLMPLSPLTLANRKSRAKLTKA